MRNRFRKTLLATTLALMIVAAAQAAEPVVDRSPMFSPFDLTWRDVREFILIVGATASTLGPSLWWALKSKLAGDFAAKREVQELSTRLAAVEGELHRLPSERDFKDLTNRVGKLENAVSVTNAKLDGLKELLGRVDYSVKLLVKHHIDGGSDD